MNLLDSTFPQTILSSNSIDTEYVTSCRLKVEEALENFFYTYSQIREKSRHLVTSNIDSICFNTFLLLVLRLVHITITTAEDSETLSFRLDILAEQTDSTSNSTRVYNWKVLLSNLFDYIGLRFSFGKFIHAMKTSLSVFVSAVIVLTFRDHLLAYGWVYWAPMTTALVSDSSAGGTLRLSIQRLVAVLFGTTYAYIIVLVSRDRIAVGIFISLFVALMGYIKTDHERDYLATVCGQSASLITFLSNQEGFEESIKAVLARTSLTFLGIFIHVLISNLILPMSARRLTKKQV